MELETLATGYGLLEGPRVDEYQRLYFSDLRDGGIYRRSADGRIETLIAERRGVGGIALCENPDCLVISGQGLLCWDYQRGQGRELFTEFEGRALRFNDLQPDRLGSIVVGSVETDPASRKSIPGSLFRVDPDGTVTKLWEGIELSNGLGFSPDGKLLYHSDSPTQAIWVYDVMADRTLRDRRVFARIPQGWPDGLTIDAEGGVLAAVVKAGEVVRFKSDGTLDWRVKVPGRFVTSLSFGGDDLRDLYIVTGRDKTGAGTIYRGRTEIPGLRVPKAALT